MMPLLGLMYPPVISSPFRMLAMPEKSSISGITAAILTFFNFADHQKQKNKITIFRNKPEMATQYT